MSISVHSRHDSTDSRAAARRQEGSAYVVTLMILLVLSVIGLSLTIVTQTESSIGSQERLIQSVFYAAEGGLNAALSRRLVRDGRPLDYELRGEGVVSGITAKNSTQVRANFVQVGRSSCFGCEESETGEDRFVSALYYGEADATRRAGQGNDCAIPLARKGMTWMVQAFPVPDDKSSRDDLLAPESPTPVLPPPVATSGCSP